MEGVPSSDLEPCDGLARGHSLGVEGKPAHEHAGERRADLLVADLAEELAGGHRSTDGEILDGCEYTGARAHHKALGGEEVLTLVEFWRSGLRRRGQFFEEAVEVVGGIYGEAPRLLEGALDESGEDVARSEFDEGGSAEVGEALE